MLTMDEIKNISFRKANFGGYNSDDVDAFIDDVISSFEQLKKEKTNLVHKIDVLATRVEQYRADEETVRNALLASQKVSDACIREAKDKSAKIIREAENKAQSLLVDANKMTVMEKDNYLQLQSDAVKLRAELIELYKKHIKAIDDLPTSADVQKSKQVIDSKYPTEEIVENKEVKTSEQPVQPVEEVQQNSVDDKTKVIDKITDVEEENAKHSKKFEHLKFGDNYDVSAD